MLQDFGKKLHNSHILQSAALMVLRILNVDVGEFLEKPEFLTTPCRFLLTIISY
jgi:hypothetical protein